MKRQIFAFLTVDKFVKDENSYCFNFLYAYFTADLQIMFLSMQQIFDNIINRDIPWPKVPDEISYEAYDLLDK